MKNSRTGVLCLALVVTTILLFNGCGHTRTGEIEVYKIAPASPARGAGGDSDAHILKARGFDVGENSFRLTDSFGGFSAVSLSNLRSAAQKLESDAYQAYLRRGKSSEDPEAKNLEELHKSIRALRLKIPPPEPVEKIVYALLKDVQEILVETEAVQEVYESLWRDYEKTHSLLSFPYTFRVGGRSLQRGIDYIRWIRETPKGNPVRNKGQNEVQFKPSDPAERGLGKLTAQPVSEELDFIQVSTQANSAFGELETRLKARLADLKKDPRVNQLAPFGEEATNLEKQVANIVERYRELIEYGLNFSAASIDRERRSVAEIYRQSNPNLIQSLPVRGAFDRTVIAGESIRINASEIFDYLREILKSTVEGHQEERLELEAFARQLADKTGGPLFRPLLPAPEGKPPTLVTFELRTLYLRALGKNEPTTKSGLDAKGTQLLVTCAIKNSDNSEEAVYPVIFEDNYLPAQSVNRKDRIIYGPAPYTGLTFNINLTVMQLAKYGNDQVKSAIGSATKMVALANPELAAISPVVTALFGNIVDNIELDRKEFDISFSLPQPSARNKSNTRFMISETGHYILIKRESPARGLGNVESERQLYRTLIYNAHDGYLYKRRNLANPSENFKKENLFLDQSYAVIVVTDQDSNESDKLGEKLRKQVGQSLGTSRSSKLIPDVDETRKLIAQYMVVSGRTNKLATLDGESFATLAKKLKDDLWSDVPETEKGFIVDTLLARADESARLQLGTDPERWKNAAIRVDNQGIIRLADQLEQTDAIVIPEQSAHIVFPFGASLQTNNLTFFLEDSSGARAPNLSGIGQVDATGKVVLAVPATGLSSDYFRAIALQTSSKTIAKSRKYDFQGFPFTISEVKTNGIRSKVDALVFRTNDSPSLDFTFNGPGGYSGVGYVAYEGKKQAANSTNNVVTLKLLQTASTNSVRYVFVPKVFATLYETGMTNRVPMESVEVLRIP